jgi:hypothetical protein
MITEEWVQAIGGGVEGSVLIFLIFVFFLCHSPLFFTYHFVFFFPVRSFLCGVEFLGGEVRNPLT